MNYDEHPIDRIYVEWANTLDSAGQDSGPARERLDIITLAILFDNMRKVIDVGDVTDSIKKWIFYGKESEAGTSMAFLTDESVRNADAALADHNTIRILHAILGITGEAAEMMKMLLAHVFEGKPLDFENLIEEGGDSLWYHALLARANNFATLDEFMLANKAKLTARYGTTWSQDAAINRDTQNEMAQMNKSLGDGFEKGIGFEAQKKIVRRCPGCGHQPHEPKGCFNIQSDNDCECGRDSTSEYTIDGRDGVWSSDTEMFGYGPDDQQTRLG